MERLLLPLIRSRGVVLRCDALMLWMYARKKLPFSVITGQSIRWPVIYMSSKVTSYLNRR